MSSVNKVIIVGSVGRDAEIRSTQGGDRIAQLSVATNETWRDKASGERKESTTWHRVVVFNERLVEVIEKYVRKGSKLYLEGALQNRKYTDRDGVERYTTEIVLSRFRGELVMLDSREREEQPQSRADKDQTQFGSPARASAATMRDLDDEIPF